jgi:predicted dehydrogenase
VLGADARIFIPERPVPAGAVVGHATVQTTGEMGPVTTDDVTMLLAEFEAGAVGQIIVSRIATGIPNSLGFRIIGSQGSVAFDSVHPDEFQLYTTALEEPSRNGPRTVIVGQEHPYFGHTIPMPARGVASGYGAAFVAQAQDFIGAIVKGGQVETDFWAGYRTMLVCEAAQRASDEHAAVDIASLDAELRTARTGVGVR